MATAAKPRVTSPQRYALGQSVQNAYERFDWDGNIRSKHRPKLVGHATEPTANALLRMDLIEEVKSEGYRVVLRLTKLGIEIGTEECVERFGQHPRAHAEEEKAAKDKAEEEKAAEIAKIAAPFAKFKVRWGKKKVTVASLLEDELANRYNAHASLSKDQWTELGEQIAKL